MHREREFSNSGQKLPRMITWSATELKRREMVLNPLIRLCLKEKNWVWAVCQNKGYSWHTVLDTVRNAVSILLFNPHKRDGYYLYFTDLKTKTQRSREMWQSHTASKRWSQDMHSEKPRTRVCMFNHYATFVPSLGSGSWGYICIWKIVSICLSFLLPPLLPSSLTSFFSQIFIFIF